MKKTAQQHTFNSRQLIFKELFVGKILDQDMQVLALIDDAKSKIIRELQDVRLAKKAMAGYKSA